MTTHSFHPPRKNSAWAPNKGRRARQGFTLVEVLVAMALIVFIMSILSTAFGLASKVFRDLKATGDLAERLRGVTTLMRRDLAAPHFDGNPPVFRKLSDVNFWGPNPTTAPVPPPEGFFRIWQDQASAQIPPPPAVAVTENFTYTTTRSMLHFMVRLPGLSTGQPGDFFSTLVPAGSPLFSDTAFNQEQRYQTVPPPLAGTPTVFRSPSAEVAYWLTPATDPSGQPSVAGADTANPQPLYVLRRRQRLLWEIGAPPLTVDIPGGPGYEEISYPAFGPPTATVRANRPVEVTAPPFRLGMRVDPSPYTGADLPSSELTAAGIFPPPGPTYPSLNPDDVLLTDVLSFDVRILLHGATEFVDLYHPSVQAFVNGAGNPAYTAANGPRVFDTWSNKQSGRYRYDTNWLTPGTPTSIPLLRTAPGQQPIRIRAIQITIRVWDSKTQITRQSSMTQEL
jgi:prepilin-type N-terminal cleavage/methylation domain-containing protein